MDEPTSALDPISTMKIEDLMEELKKKYTVVIVTHNMQQAARISDDTAFFLVGELVEFGETKQIFSYPKDKRTEDFLKRNNLPFSFIMGNTKVGVETFIAGHFMSDTSWTERCPDWNGLNIEGVTPQVGFRINLGLDM